MSEHVLQSSTVVLSPHATRQAELVMADTLRKPHMPGIDVLRGVAILAVIFFHGVYYDNPSFEAPNLLARWFYVWCGWGAQGVTLFFVLSGFLITGILHDTQSYRNYYSRFYIRRALRILPVYLVTLLLCWMTGFISYNYAIVCIFFLANLPGLFLRHGYIGYSPLWSLAVEEQFNLVWPFLSRKLKTRGMLLLSIVLMIVCPILRALAFAHIIHAGEPTSKTWFIADNMAAGAILAILIRSPGVALARFIQLGWALFVVGLAGIVVLYETHHADGYNVLGNSIGASCFYMLFSGVVIFALCSYQTRKVQSWLQGFIFFGDISYGLYLFHMLCLQIYDRYNGDGYMHDWRKLMLRFFVANGIAVIVATVS